MHLDRLISTIILGNPILRRGDLRPIVHVQLYDNIKHPGIFRYSCMSVPKETSESMN
jgi:hypothetical protein